MHYEALNSHPARRDACSRSIPVALSNYVPMQQKNRTASKERYMLKCLVCFFCANERKRKSKSGTRPYPRGASASAPPKGRKSTSLLVCMCLTLLLLEP
jgi:hypothetical protein